MSYARENFWSIPPKKVWSLKLRNKQSTWNHKSSCNCLDLLKPMLGKKVKKWWPWWSWFAWVIHVFMGGCSISSIQIIQTKSLGQTSWTSHLLSLLWQFFVWNFRDPLQKKNRKQPLILLFVAGGYVLGANWYTWHRKHPRCWKWFYLSVGWFKTQYMKKHGGHHQFHPLKKNMFRVPGLY